MSLTDKNNYIPNGWTRLPNGKLVKGDASENEMVTSYKRILNKSDEQFKSIKIVHAAELKVPGSNWQEYFQRRIKHRHFENNDQKPDPVFEWADVALTLTGFSFNRQIADGVPCPEKCHGAGCRIGKAIGQQVDELAKLVRPHGTKA